MSRFPLQRIAIIGLGLMGGSLALALRQRGFDGSLFGADQSAANLALAGSAQKTSAEPVFDALVADAAALPWSEIDLLVLAVPPAALPFYYALAAGQLSAAAIVTDLASVKGEHVAQAEALLGSRFLSSHPLIGAERQGFAAARAELYTDYRCVLCPGTESDGAVEEALRQFWQALGAQVIVLSSTDHDQALAATSHLPHLLASTYLALLADDASLEELAGSGLRDFSRIAASDPPLWAEILGQNRVAVLHWLRRLQGQLALVEAELAKNDQAALRSTLARGQAARARFHFPAG